MGENYRYKIRNLSLKKKKKNEIKKMGENFSKQREAKIFSEEKYSLKVNTRKKKWKSVNKGKFKLKQTHIIKFSAHKN